MSPRCACGRHELLTGSMYLDVAGASHSAGGCSHLNATAIPPQPALLEYFMPWERDSPAFHAAQALIADRDQLQGVSRELYNALKESVSLQSHQAGLLNQYDGGERMQFASVDAWLTRIRELKQQNASEVRS